EPGVLRILAACGSEIMVSHPAEARLALNCGFPSASVAYQRPVLLEEEIRDVLNVGIDFLHAFRLQDLEVIERVGSLTGKKIRVSLRLRNDSLGRDFSPTYFLARRMGLQPSEILAAGEQIRHSLWMRLVGINFYRGTQQESVNHYQKLLGRALRLAAELYSRSRIALEEINVGGGIPSPSLRKIGLRCLISPCARSLISDPVEQLESFASRLSARFHRQAQRVGLRFLPAIAAEPGRAIVGNAGILVTRVRAVVGNWLFLDASRNHLGESPLLFGRAILPVAQTIQGRWRRYHLSGNTLNTTDLVSVWRKLPVLREGDLMALCDAGAYSISRASRYAGLSPAVYIVYRDGSIQMIRRAENFSDLLTGGADR
ncbi:MAG: hypothetical protein HY644_10925, partial [Acidobacteria bacterium]|nr:hypothetical protein [Acidobacteriota bacterium]